MVRDKYSGWGRYLALGLVLTMALLSFYGCSGDDGSAGAPGLPGASAGTLDGSVTFQDFQDNPVNLSGVSVTTSPDQGSATTAADGTYSLSLPIGNYTVTYSLANFESQTASVSIVASDTETVDVSLVPTTPVVVQATASNTSPAPGDVVDISVTTTPVDGSTVTSILWTAGSVPVVIADDTAASTTVTLPGPEVYKTELYNHVENLNRTVVQAVNPFALEEAGHVGLTAEVTTTSGTYSGETALATVLPFVVNGGIRTVPVGVPVLLHGKDMDDATWTWSIDTQPGTATLDDANSRNPVFTPDAAGVYDISFVNSGAAGESITVYAGTWEGVLGSGADGVNSECTVCHSSSPINADAGEAYDKMLTWMNSGHAEIFTDNLNTSTHYGESCFPCHTVGFDTSAANGGIDDQADYAAFLAANLLNNPSDDNWTTMLADYPESAQRANIQCENCHGPNAGTTLHATGTLMEQARVSISADVCGACHGEPKRHARFQQWEESHHGDTEFAIDESLGSDGYARNCSLCHSGNGFVAWEEAAAFAPDQDTAVIAFVNATIDAGAHIFSQTCAACHPPHDPGDTSGEPNTAKVRVENTTPETKGGFIATGVGHGATCMMCHNNRRGAYNTTLRGLYFNGNLEMDDTSPHHGPQGDILMGENAFFVTVGARSPHSFITDTCTNCHMVLTPPPAELSYNLGGTNHTFEPSLEICSECHGAFDGGTLQDSVAALCTTLSTAVTDAVMADINSIATQATAVLINVDDADSNGVIDPNPANGELDALIDTSANPANTIASIAFGSRGRFNITLADATVLSNVSYSNIVVWVDNNTDGVIDVAEVYEGDTNGEGIVDSTIASGSTAGTIATNGQTIAMARWNLILVDEDKSGGIHNPSFVIGALNGAIAALMP